MINVAFALEDHNGNAVTPSSYRGKWMLIFFGFTHCKIICPRNLAKLSTALELLGSEADRIAPLYISVDPERDTPDRMKAWLGENYPRFTGLTGDKAAVEQARSSFRVYARRRELPGGEESYDMPHTSITYLIDPSGQYRRHFSDVVDAETIATKILEEFSLEGDDA